MFKEGLGEFSYVYNLNLPFEVHPPYVSKLTIACEGNIITGFDL